MSDTIEPTEAEARRLITETLVWEGVTILISYEPDWMGLAAKGIGWPHSHLEIQVVEPKGAPLPLTDTGYLSQFLEVGEAEEAGGPSALIRAQLEEFAQTKTWHVRRARWEQRDLFG